MLEIVGTPTGSAIKYGGTSIALGADGSMDITTGDGLPPEDLGQRGGVWYFVRPQDGSDAASGLSWQEAFASMTPLDAVLNHGDSLSDAAGAKPLASDAWIADLRTAETEAREAERAELTDARAPLHPMRLYAELAAVLDRDAIVIGDGGDYVSYAGRVVDSYEPGCWLDPGPFGCLGTGPGYALAAKLARPDRQVVLLLGDGAFGFSGMEYDTLARHGVAVVGVMGNNGIWALEKHPMEFLYGYSVAAELRPETRYDEVVAALGCHGELARRPEDVRPALERAFSAGVPALVNVLTDPAVAYPRRSNLA